MMAWACSIRRFLRPRQRGSYAWRCCSGCWGAIGLFLAASTVVGVAVIVGWLVSLA